MRSFDNEKNKQLIFPIFMPIIGLDGAVRYLPIDKVRGVGGVTINIVFEETIEHFYTNQF